MRCLPQVGNAPDGSGTYAEGDWRWYKFYTEGKGEKYGQNKT